MTKELVSFIDFLKKQGLKLTNQREEILRVFLQSEKHLTAEELYGMVKKKDPRIGQATVFRTLRLLSAAGLAGEENLGDKKLRYEHKYGRSQHGHLVCRSCGRVIEVVDPKIERLQHKLCQRFRFLPQKHRLQIFGICKDCRSKIQGAQKNV